MFIILLINTYWLGCLSASPPPLGLFTSQTASDTVLVLILLATKNWFCAKVAKIAFLIDQFWQTSWNANSWHDVSAGERGQHKRRGSARHSRTQRAFPAVNPFHLSPEIDLMSLFLQSIARYKAWLIVTSWSLPWCSIIPQKTVLESRIIARGGKTICF